MVRPFWNNVPVKSKKIVTQLGHGINNGLSPFDIKDNVLSEAKNIGSRLFPALKTRESRSNFGDSLSGSAWHLGKRKDDYLTVVDGFTWKFWDGSTWQSIVSGLTETYSKTVGFMGKTLLVNGANRKYWDGTNSGDIGGGIPESNFLAVHANRVYSASRSTQKLSYSASRIYNDWTTAADAGSIVVETRDGAGASGLTTFSNHIVLFKEDSIHELFGTGPSNFTFQTLTENIGCISDRTIVEVSGVLYFLGPSGVYAYAGGTIPQLVSFPVQDYIDRMDLSRKLTASAGTDGERYYLSIPIDTSGRIMLVFDARQNVRKWYVEDEENVVEFAFLQNSLYGLTYDGQIKKMIDTSASESVDWYAITRPYSFGGLSGKNSLNKLFFVIDLPEASTFKCAISTQAQDGTFTDIKTFTGSTAIQKARIEVPLTIAQNVDWYRIKLYGTGPCTVHAMEQLSRVRTDSYA